MAEYFERQVEAGFLFLNIELERLGLSEEYLVWLGLLARGAPGSRRYATTELGNHWMVEGEYGTILIRRMPWLALQMMLEDKTYEIRWRANGQSAFRPQER